MEKVLIQRPDLRMYEGFLYYWQHGESLGISYKYYRDILGIPELRQVPRTNETAEVRGLSYFGALISGLAAFSNELTHSKHDLIWTLLYCNSRKFAIYLTHREELLRLVRENPNWLNSWMATEKILSTQYSEPLSQLGFKLGTETQPGFQQNNRKTMAEILAEKKLQSSQSI